MDTFYRATLHLHRVDSNADGYSLTTTEISAHTVTGDTAADAMTQLCAHADSLYEWHQQLADLASDAEPEPLPLLDEAVKPASGWMDQVLRDLYESTTKYKFEPAIGVFSALSHPGRHRCAVCGKPGPLLHEGNSYVCADCNAVLDAQKADAERAAEPLVCHCSTTQHDTGIELHPDADCPVHGERPFVACKAPDPNGPGRFCLRGLGHRDDCYYVPVDQLPDSADDEGEPGQEGAEAENDPAFTDTETPSRKEM